MKDNWQKDIHNRLGNYEINEPEGLWKDIRKEMAGANGGYVRNSKSSVTFRLRRMASVAAAASVALLWDIPSIPNIHTVNGMHQN